MRRVGSVRGFMEQGHPTELQRRKTGQEKIPTGGDAG